MLTPGRTLRWYGLGGAVSVAVLAVAGFAAGEWSTRPPDPIGVPGAHEAARGGIAVRGDLLVFTLPGGGCPEPVGLDQRAGVLEVRVVDPYPGRRCTPERGPRTRAVRIDRATVGVARRDVRVTVAVTGGDRPSSTVYTLGRDGASVRPG
jgi:hypothetical protein